MNLMLHDKLEDEVMFYAVRFNKWKNVLTRSGLHKKNSSWNAKLQKSLYIADFAVEKILKATSRHEFKFSGENDSKNGLI